MHNIGWMGTEGRSDIENGLEFDGWRLREGIPDKANVLSKVNVGEQKYNEIFMGLSCLATSFVPCITPGVSFM